MSKERYLLFWISLFWFTAVLSFLNILPLPILFSEILLFSLHIYVLFFKTIDVTNFICFSIILSPIFGSLNVFGINILFSDFLLFFTFFILLFKNKLINNSKIFFFLFLLLMFHTTMHLLIGDIISLKPIISISELFIIYIIYKQINGINNNYNFFYSVVLSTLIGIFLMFVAFYKGINLNDFEGDSQILIKNATELSLENYRMSFFYTNFPFIISSTLFIILFLLNNNLTFVKKVVLIFLLFLISMAIITSGNKTVMLTTLIIYILSNFFFNGNSFYNKMNIFKMFLFLIIIYFSIYNIFLNEFNSDLFTERLGSSASFDDRIGVFVNVLVVLKDNLYRILIGYGPDFLTNAGNSDLANQFKINYYTKIEQGAVDSGIITFMIEFGLLLFSLILFIIFKRVKNLYNKPTNLNILYIQIIFVFIISSLTQLVGLSKIFWFFAIIFALSKKNKSFLSYKITSSYEKK